MSNLQSKSVGERTQFAGKSQRTQCPGDRRWRDVGWRTNREIDASDCRGRAAAVPGADLLELLDRFGSPALTCDVRCWDWLYGFQVTSRIMIGYKVATVRNLGNFTRKTILRGKKIKYFYSYSSFSWA